ncbi:amidase [[Pseudomonas] carboxydohydrogena]
MVMVSVYEQTQAALRVIKAREPEVRAWIHLDEESALEAARAIDRRAAGGELYGVILAAKDIFETADMPTAFGSPIYKDYRPVKDAAVVAKLREKGALILGKTYSTEFAAAFPTPTRNPHNLDHTPGGSSSGSAAAVASGMVRVALGTQTLGSIIRPASYCGIVGFKPTYGRVSRSGVLNLSETLDTIGFLGATLDDVAQVFYSLVDETAPAGIPHERKPRFAFCKGPGWDDANADVQSRIGRYVDSLREEGACIETLDLRSTLSEVLRAVQSVHDAEAYRNFTWERTQHFDLLSAAFQKILSRGEAVTREAYERALIVGEVGRVHMQKVFENFDGLITLSATQEAPRGLASTGSPSMNAAWTFLRGPCVSLPKLKSANGLSVGIQLIGKPFDDSHLLGCARWLDARCPET